MLEQVNGVLRVAWTARKQVTKMDTGSKTAILTEYSLREHTCPRLWQLTRAQRVVGITLVLGALNVLDLWYTVTAHQVGALFEANPIAAYVIDVHGVFGISIFKTTLVALAVGGFMRGRRLLLAEVGCTTAAVIYLIVVCLWCVYPLDALASR